jgi:ABC-2 type transport system permease protein
MAAESTIVISSPATHAALRSVPSTGWSSGFANLLRHELRPWLSTRFGLVQAVVWLVAVNGLMALPLWIAPRFDAGEQSAIESQGGPLTLGLLLFFRLGVQICGLGAAILAMGALVSEKQSGTAAWVLSKPASRVAFVLAKVTGLTFGVLITMVALEAVIAYAHIGVVARQFPDLAAFAVGTAMLALAVMFALALTIMLGAFFNSRGAVVGVAIAVLFGQQVLGNFLGPIANYLPNNLGNLASALTLGQPHSSVGAVVTTALLAICCVALAIWRFSRDEL